MDSISVGKNLTFDDLTLVPRVVSTIKSRTDISTNTTVNWHNIENLDTPIIASPMVDVCNGSMAHQISILGGLGIIHRFMSPDKQVEAFCLGARNRAACAIGINGDSHNRFKKLYETGCRTFCIDVANGANTEVGRVIEHLSNYNIDIIAGNVASAECFEYLAKFPKVRAIRVGIAGGKACTTKNATGIGYGMLSSIMECAAVKLGTLLIADGGIREPSDMCKAIAAGADLVMLGSVLANTSDSPADIVKKDGVPYKVYHGSSSFDIQSLYKESPQYIEGAVRLLEFNGESLDNVITKFTEGLRSSMSYFNAKNLKEYRTNVTWSGV